MLLLEQFTLIPIEELEHSEDDTWLFKLEIRQQKSTLVPSNPAITSLNSTINLKDTSEWLDNISPADVLLQEVTPNEKLSELEQTKIIDTRTFTRPRKNRTSPSPLRPTTHQPTDINNLNSTFNFQAGDNVNGEVLNATVVIEDSTIHKLGATQGELNATFPVEINEPAIEEDFSPCNNNVYNLNSTFQTIVSVNRSVSATATISLKPVLNTTYSEEEAVQVAPVPANNVGSSRQCSLDELNELDELEDVDRCDVNEMVFRKPLMPGAVPKRPLIRTSTWNNEIPGSPKKQLIGPVITPPSTNGMKDVEKFAKIQEDSLAQTSTPMGQRRFCAFQRATEVDHNLGSPISSLADGTVNFGPPIPLKESIAGHANSDSLLDNSNNVIRGHLTFDKSQNSVENQSISPTSPASSPYSSQSLESETAGYPASAQELIRRSMPNLNNPSRMRLPQPSALAGNLNRQHGSDSGLRPPSTGLRPPSSVNGTSSLIRPQFKVPQPPTAVAQVVANSNRTANTTTTDPVRSTRLQPRSSAIAAPPTTRHSYLPNAVSKLQRPSQLLAPRATLPVKTAVMPAAKAVDELNATVVMDKPSVVTAAVAAAPVQSGIPRPSLSRIPMPRTMKSSIPMPAARARGPPQ